MLPYGVGADSISARAIWGNAKSHGRALLAPTMHFFDSLRLPSRGATILVAAPKGSPQRGAPAQRVRGGRDATNFPPPTSSPHKNHKTQNRGMP